MSGKNELLQNVKEMSGNFISQPDEARIFGPDVFSCLIHQICSFNIVREVGVHIREMSGEYQGSLVNPC